MRCVGIFLIYKCRKPDGQEIGRVALVAESDIQEATYLDYLKKILNYF